MDEPPITPSEPAAEPAAAGDSWLTTTPAESPPANTLELWSPKGIGIASVFLGFPGATVLAALNWRRMGQPRKAIAHLAAVVIGIWALIFVAESIIPLIGLGVSYYLYAIQKSDQMPLAAAGQVTGRSGLVGALIAIIGTVLILGSAVLVWVAAGLDDYEHRGEVLFFPEMPPDDCDSTGQATVFAPGDSIFQSVVMRETVQPGSRVVVELDRLGVTEGSAPITVEPPYDCLSSSNPLGSLEAGTYTVRYRYVGQPEASDLASGTFTVSASSVASPSP